MVYVLQCNALSSTINKHMLKVWLRYTDMISYMKESRVKAVADVPVCPFPVLPVEVRVLRLLFVCGGRRQDRSVYRWLDKGDRARGGTVAGRGDRNRVFRRGTSFVVPAPVCRRAGV